MKTWRLNLEEVAVRGGANVGVEIVAADLTAATATQTINLLTVAAKMGAALVSIELKEAFASSDETLISTAFTVGDGSLATRWLSSTEANAAGTEVFLKGGTLANTALPYVFTGDDTIDLFLTATTGKALNTHTAGKLRLYFNVTDARA